MNTPVVFLIFNRPDLTEQVFQAIAQAKPNRLLVVADGPRNENERVLCEQAREIIKKVDWPCEVQTNFSKTNLGCKKRVSSGLDWAFSLVEEAIILEDDCLPHPDFFRFCEEMLDRYRDDERIMHITGSRFLPTTQEKYSYYFSNQVLVWGWASWRRAWQHYDVNMERWPLFREDILGLLASKAEVKHYSKWFDMVANGTIDTWDIQWLFSCWTQSGLSISPAVNLISNMGFRNDATHTLGQSIFADLPVGGIGELSHPPIIIPDKVKDAQVLKLSIAQEPKLRLSHRVANKLRHMHSKVKR